MSLNRKLISEDDFINCFLNPQLSLIQSEGWWIAFIQILRFERLLSVFAFKCELACIMELLPSFVQEHLINAQVLSERQEEQLKYEVTVLCATINEVTGSFLFLKGAAYCLADMSVAKGRLFSDVDILVPKDMLSNIEKKLFLKGWISKAVNSYDDNYYRSWAHEIPPLIHARRGTVIDIHHNLVPPISGKAPDIRAFWEETEIVNGFNVLKPHAMLLHSCIHLIFNETFIHSHRDLYDIASIINDFGNEVFWEETVELANRTGFYTELFLACRYSSLKLKFDLPPIIVERLPFSSMRLKFYDAIFSRALAPHHPLCIVKGRSIANFIAWVRGHWCKMPLLILIYHFSIKSGRAIVEKLFGKHVFHPAE